MRGIPEPPDGGRSKVVVGAALARDGGVREGKIAPPTCEIHLPICEIRAANGGFREAVGFAALAGWGGCREGFDFAFRSSCRAPACLREASEGYGMTSKELVRVEPLTKPRTLTEKNPELSTSEELLRMPRILRRVLLGPVAGS